MPADDGPNSTSRAARRRVVVVGCGFAGTAAARALSTRVGARTEVVAFNAGTSLYNYPILPRTLIRHVPDGHVSVPLERLLGGRSLALRIERVRAVDATAREIRTDDARMGFDYLVIACGARARTVEADDDALLLFPKSTRHLERLRRWLEQGATARGDAPVDGRRHHIVVAGGGLSGIEFAVATRELADRICATAGVPRERFQVRVHERRERIAHECPEAVSEHVTDALARLGIEVRCGAAVERAVRGAVVVAGTREPADVVLACTGSRPNLKRITLDGLGDVSRGIAVDEALRSLAAPHVYAVGDNMRWPVPGAPNLKRGAEAIRQGRHAAANIARELEGREPVAHRPRIYTGIMLGSRDALLAIGRHRLAGPLAGTVKSYLERRGPH